MSTLANLRIAVPLAAAALAADAQAQRPRLQAAVAASEHRGQLPALAWLCEEFLPELESWPEGLDPFGPLSLSLSHEGLTVSETAVALPEGAAAIGIASFSAESAAPSILWRCDARGDEQWTVQSGFELPRGWRSLLHAIEADVLDLPRTLAAPVLAGHLSGSMLEGDPRADLLRIGPALCGEITWMSWQEGDVVRVRGRSEGGLMLPLALLVMAVADGDAEPTALQLRAFAARDADKEEAARQIGRADRDLDVPTLRALLLGGDRLRLTAIDALIRRGAWRELPRIVESADPELTWTGLAARDAVLELWPSASAEVRQETRRALQESRCSTLRGIAPGARPPTPSAPRTPRDGRGPALLMLLCTGLGVLCLWRLERLRLSAAGR